MATAEDIDVLTRFRQLAQIESGVAAAEVYGNMDAALREYFAKAMPVGEFMAWLAVEGGEVIASCGMCFYRLLPSSSNPTGKIAYLTTVYTVPQFRSNGIATRLTAEAIEKAKSLGYALVRLHSSRDAESLYMKLGFVHTKGFMELRLR